MTKVCVVFLCYRDDSELVLESQRAAIRAFKAEPTLEPSFVLLEDAWCPVTVFARNRFLAASDAARVFTTTYRRGFMILGGVNLTGQCEAFQEVAESTGADMLVKMDADTCMFKADWIKEFASHNEALCAGAFDFQNGNHTSVFGLCYALKREVLEPLARDVRKFPAHHKAWEDHEVSSRVFRIADGRTSSLLRWRSNHADDGFWVVPLEGARERFVQARAVNCGWNFGSQPPDKRAAFRLKMLAWMRRWNVMLEQSEAQQAADTGSNPLVKTEADML